MSNTKWTALRGVILFVTGIVWLLFINWQIAVAIFCIVWSQGINEEMKNMRRKDGG